MEALDYCISRFLTFDNSNELTTVVASLLGLASGSGSLVPFSSFIFAGGSVSN